MALEITALRDAIGGTKGFGGGAKVGAYFGLLPNIKPALFASRVGVEAGGKGAAVELHVASQPVNGSAIRRAMMGSGCCR